MTEIVHYSRRILLLRRRHDGRPSVTRDDTYYLHNNVSHVLCVLCYCLHARLSGLYKYLSDVAFTLLLLEVVWCRIRQSGSQY